MNMKSLLIFPRSVASFLLLSGALAQAASITGTVTNKTNGKPSAGDSVVLVDVQAGMADAATTTTNAHGRYSLESPGSGPYLIRVNHQGGTYFIAAPQGGGSGDVTVYDVAAKVDGIGIDADMILAEAAGGMVRVQERYLVRNTSLPPRAQFSSNTFEFVLPPDALLDGASATRPGGLPTNTRPIPLGKKQHYTINIPIQPDQGEKETLFEVQYHLSYSGKYTFAPQPQLPADNLVVYVPKGMTFTGSGSSFQSVQEDPRVQTFVTKNVHPGQDVRFTISGEGQMPREAQQAGAMGGMGDAGSGDAGNRPGGGIGNPIDTPDPLTKFKWWILGGLAILLAAAAAFMLRRQNPLAAGVPAAIVKDEAFEVRPFPVAAHSVPPAVSQASATRPTTGNAALLNVLKEELFAIESEKLSGTISPAEYAEVKTGLEAVLKRALRNR
jgi:hypothetical protein